MKKSYAQKIQALLVSHLRSCGKINLLLPDGVQLEIGVEKEGKHGTEISDDYCYVKAEREGKEVMLDQHDISVQYKENTVIYFFDNYTDEDGTPYKRLEIV